MTIPTSTATLLNNPEFEQLLSGNALKVIAIVAMTIDHLAWVGIETYEQAETPTQIFLHCIGRLTAPKRYTTSSMIRKRS